MKKTIKTVLLKDLKPTTALIIKMREELGMALEFNTELDRLISSGIIHVVTEKTKISEEKMKELLVSGGSIYDDKIEELVESMGTSGYTPKEYTHIRVFRENYVVDGCKRLCALKKIFSGDYKVEVEELTL